MIRGRIIVVFGLLPMLFFGAGGYAQRSAGTSAKLGISVSAGQKTYYAGTDEPPRAIEFEERSVSPTYVIENINSLLKVPAEFSFREVESSTDHLGMRHRYLQQFYKDLPIEGLGYRVHDREGFVTAINGRGVRDVGLDTQAAISESSAFELAKMHVGSMDTTRRDGVKLIVSRNFTYAPGSFIVAFQFDIDVSLVERWRVSIDAMNGEVVNKVSLVNTCGAGHEPPLPYATGTGLTNYYGTRSIRVEELNQGSRLRGQTEHGGIIETYNYENVSILPLLFGFYDKFVDFYSSDKTFNLTYQRPAVSVQWAAEQAFEYYHLKHQRNSFDNNGSAIRSYVHVDQDLNNAFWTGKFLAFGDGSNNNPLVELDVVSHELTHAVTQYEARLNYMYEPGALNESFSDILGKAVEFYTFGNDATWQLARYNRPGGLRDFSNPNVKNQPDTYRGDLWYTGYDDNGGVHYNSGVQNFWFYLLCEGGSGVNDHNFQYSVNPIGMDAAVDVAYRNLTEYLTSSSDYLDSRIGSMLAAADLYGKNSAVYQEIDKAWDAVGVVDEPIVTSLEFYDITGTTVKIKGTLEPRGEVVSYHFEYGTTKDLGNSTQNYEYTGTVEGILTGLEGETTYFVRLVGTNENGSGFLDSEVTTISLAPMVRINYTVDVTEDEARLYGQINPNSLPTAYYFEYGPTIALGQTTPELMLGGDTEFLDVSAIVSGLQKRHTYFYRLKATNDAASSETEIRSFFTAVKPVILDLAPLSGPAGTEVTISGQNFHPAIERNIVRFGATRATVVSANETQLKVVVPTGASFGAVSVTDAESGLQATSSDEYTPTFEGEFDRQNIQLRVGIADVNFYAIAVDDIDGDLRPDIIGSHNEGFSVYLNVIQESGGAISEESFIRNTFPSPGFSTSNFHVIDLDGNGLKDVIGTTSTGFRIYPNYSVPGYVFFGQPVDVASDSWYNIVWGDFDNDGHIDLAGMRVLSDKTRVAILRNQNPKGIIAAENFVTAFEQYIPGYGRDLLSSDVDNDGLPDLLIGMYGEESCLVLMNKSSTASEFQLEETRIQDIARGRYVRYRVHDLNSDRQKEAISFSPVEAGSLAVLEGHHADGQISFGLPVVVRDGYADAAVEAGDLNGDGRVDLLVGSAHREFSLLSNNATAGQGISSHTFAEPVTFGLSLPPTSYNNVETQIVINDLNADGRPEVVGSYYYSYYPHDGYELEIWQNASKKCPEPSQVTVESTYRAASIILPEGTVFEDFEIGYNVAGSLFWYDAQSTGLDDLIAGRHYQLRVRAKCFLTFSEYHYIDFVTECVDLSSFHVVSINETSVFLSANNLSALRVDYTEADKEDWKPVAQYSSEINNLKPGTTYVIRYSGRCEVSNAKYTEVTTLCPVLTELSVTDVTFNSAVAVWTSTHEGSAYIEYSDDNVQWREVVGTTPMFPLIPGRTYFLRGRLACTDVDSDFVYTAFTTACPVVSDLRAGAVTPSSVAVSWDDPSETGRYIVKYSMQPGGIVTSVETEFRSFELTGLTPGSRYRFEVAPVCLADEYFSSIVLTTMCYTPINLTVDQITHTTAELSWDDEFGLVPYTIDYSISGSGDWASATGADRRIALNDLRPGTKYEARVAIHCVSVVAPFVSVVFQTMLYDETTFAPNPVDEQMTIYPARDLIGRRFVMYDNTGRMVSSGNILSYRFDLSALPSGLYILKIEGEKVTKIVKR